MKLVVLIVEDEPLELEFLQKIVLSELSPQDRIITATTGLQAVALAREHCPNLIFMDIILPEMDGLAAIKTIRRFLPHSCILISSASSDFYYAQQGIALGVHQYLLKPIKPSSFREAVKKAVVTARQQPISTEKEAALPDEDPQRSYIEEAKAYIQEHFREHITLDMVAEHIYMNAQYFSRIFKKEVGVTYTEYVNQLKVAHAKQLLETTDYPAYRISGECGFTDPSYFNRVFSQQVGMTPMDYKKGYLIKKGTKNPNK